MHSLDINYLKNINLSLEQASSIQKIGEFKGKQELFFKQTPEVLETLREVAIVESVESSNRLEGITASPQRIHAIVLKSTQPRNRSEQDISGYRYALDLIHGSAENMVFSVNVIKQLHSMIYRFKPEDGGKWKMKDNEIIETNPDGSIARVRFKAVPAILTPQAMDDLTKYYKAAIELHHKEPLIIIPLTILDFLCIHPFKDGNGRVARLLTLMLLYHFDYQVGRYISLERIFEESKETYYDTLELSSQGWHEGKHDVSPWMNYFWGVILKAYKEFEERVGTIRTSKGSKTEMIKQAVNQRINPFSISDIESDCPGVSREMIRIVLNQLREDGVLILKSKGRGAKYIHKKE